MLRNSHYAIRTFIVILGLTATTALLAAETLTPKQFTMRYASAVEAAYEGSTAKIIGDLEVEITNADKQSTRSYLDNAYISYQSDLEALDDVLQQYVAAVANTFNQDPKNDIDRLFPIIKNNSYIAEIKSALSQSENFDSSKSFPMYYEQLNRELVLMYAFDSETGMSMASTEDIDAFDIAGPALRARAVVNLMSYLPEISLQGSDNVSVLIADGNYEASLILVDEIWNNENFDVAGDIVVFVPARDILLVTGSKDAEGLAEARKVIKDNEWSYFISKQAFVRSGNNWVVLDKP